MRSCARELSLSLRKAVDEIVTQFFSLSLPSVSLSPARSLQVSLPLRPSVRIPMGARLSTSERMRVCVIAGAHAKSFYGSLVPKAEQTPQGQYPGRQFVFLIRLRIYTSTCHTTLTSDNRRPAQRPAA